MKIFCKLLRKEFLCQKFAINILSELKLTTRAPTIDLKPVNRTMEKIRHKNCLTQIHQETLRHVSPWVQVKVQSDIDVRVRVCNVHQYPDGNVFIAELHGPFKSNCAANMTVHTSSSGQLIDVVVKELKKDSNFHCELIVPVKASLCLHTQQDAMVENLFGKELTVKASRVIDVTDVRSDDINLETFNGDINCRGIFLANEAVLQATGLGKISMDKVQGVNALRCFTENGEIYVGCCYAHYSKFETDSGRLILRNIHKKCEVYVHQKGSLDLNGFDGNLKVHMKKDAGSMYVQLSELDGESVIRLDGQTAASSSSEPKERVICISDDIEKHTAIQVNVTENESKIHFKESLQHFKKGLDEKEQSLQWPPHSSLKERKSSHLRVISYDSITLESGDWVNRIRQLHMQNLPTKDSSSS